MALQIIDIGAAPDDGTGNPLRDALDKVNDNFTELYAKLLPRNIVRALNLTNFTTAATISLDNSIPQISEGAELLTADITPTSTTSWIRAVAVITSCANAITNNIAAMFVEGGANAVAANFATVHAGNYSVTIVLDYQYVPGTTSPQTIAVKVGPSTATTLRVNGVTANQVFNGTSYGAVLTLEEIHV